MNLRASILIVVVFLFSFVRANAQSFEEQLKSAEQIKSLYGETDERYLDALSKAIQSAANEQNYDVSIKYRTIHADIIKKKYGASSLEYANDLWRLGNTNHLKGDDKKASDYYQKSATIYESKNAISELPYCMDMWNLYLYYDNQHKTDKAIYYLEKHIASAELLEGKTVYGTTVSIDKIANAYMYLADSYCDKKDYLSAYKALEKCIAIVEKYYLYHTFDDPLDAYTYIIGLCINLNDVENEIKWLNRKSDVRKLTKYDDTSDDYIMDLRMLNLCYYSLNDFNSIESTTNKIISSRKKNAQQKGYSLDRDSIFVDALESIVSFGIALQENQRIIPFCRDLLVIYSNTIGQNSSKYWKALDNLLTCYYVVGDYNTAYSIFKHYEDISSALGIKQTEDYYDYLTAQVDILNVLYKLDELDSAIQELTDLADKLYGRYSEQTITTKSLLAQKLAAIGREEDALVLLQESLDILNSRKFHFDDEQDKLLFEAIIHNLQGYCLVSINPTEAKTVLLKSVEEYKSLNSNNIYMPLSNLGMLYCYFADYKKAAEYQLEAKKELEKNGDTTSISYIGVLNDLAASYQALGLTSLAITILDLIQNTVEKEYGKYHTLYASILQNKSLFYARITNYTLAIKYGEEAKNSTEAIYGSENEKYAICLQNLGMYYQYIGNYDLSKEYLLNAVTIFEKINSSQVVYAYGNLLSIYAYEKNWDEFDTCCDIIDNLIKKYNLQNTDIAASYMGTVAYWSSVNGLHNAKAYEFAINVLEQNGLLGSLQHFTILLYYNMSSFLDSSQREDFIPKLYSEYKNLYLNDISFYNDNERETFVTNPRYTQLKDVLFSLRDKGGNDGQLYDFLLFNKGLLLETSLSYKKAVNKSGNATLIEKYNKLQEINKYINGENVQLEEDYSLEEAKEKSSTLEREITLALRQNGGYANDMGLSYTDIIENLNDGDLAIEFVNYFDYSDDNNYYAAMLLRKDFEKPAFVKLCKKEELERLASLAPNKIYSESVPSKQLYNLIWNPISEYLPTTKRIIFSPSGVLHKLAIEQLYDGENRIGEIYKITRVSSTREICNRASTSQIKYNSAILYGGLVYDESDETMVAESKRYLGNQSASLLAFNTIESGTTRKGWNYLPGTLSEINEISSIIDNAKIKCEVFKAEKGNEESFKALSGKPFEILHIATHGFYITSRQAERNEFFNAMTLNSQPNNTSSALLRSGLLLAGGNKAWCGDTIPGNIEDGVLTAAEIANIDLSNCDIVVLSACETGLGEIADEGVFGLQRAFKNAGVSTIIMSLWEVDDQATSLLMQTFYKNLVSGKNKREALSIAQDEVRKQFPEPVYWAAFIMLD